MIVQLLGLIDILISANFGLMLLGVFIKTLILIFGIYLIAKGIAFISSIASFIDIAVGILLIISYFTILPKFLMVMAALILLQKGIFSFL
jgi:hypothetical protein